MLTVCQLGLFSITVNATTSTYDIRITYGGAYIYNVDETVSGKFTIPREVYKSPNIYDVVGISDYAFENCTELTEVVIPDTVEEIGSNAFYGCTNLKTIDIPDSVTSIGDSAFENCKNLESINISDNIRTIGEKAFYSTAYYNNAKNWDDNILYLEGCLIDTKDSNLDKCYIDESTKLFADKAFYECSSLTEISIPENIKYLGLDTFRNCKNLKTVNYNALDAVIYTSLNSIFEGCDLLENIFIGNSVVKIPDNLFNGCKSVEKLILPTNIQYIGSNSFGNCTSISVWYSGTTSLKQQIDIKDSNLTLDTCQWFFNICQPTSHVYKNTCDATCENCDWIRENIGHEYKIVNNEYICSKCQYVRLNPKYFNVTYCDVIEYGEDAEKEKIKVSYKNIFLNENKNYLIRYEKSYHEVIINIVGINDYDGVSDSVRITKTKKDLSNATITVNSCMFTGKPLKPTVTVNLNDIELVESKDFEVSYYNNTSVGDNTAGVIITGKGNYRGYAEKKFSITEFKPSITNDTVKNYNKSSVKITGGYLELPECLKSYELTASDGNVVESKSYNAPGASFPKIYFPKTGTYYVTYYTQGYSYVAQTGGAGLRYYWTGYPTERTTTVYYTSASSTPSTISPTQLTPNFESIDYKTLLLSVSDKNSNAKLDGITWVSSNTNVAAINANGVLDLKIAGKTVITAKVGSEEAKFDLNIEPLNISSKGKILSYILVNNACTVEYDGCILRENIDYIKSFETKGNAKILTVKGINLFDGELKAIYYSETDNKYCADSISLSAPPTKIEYKANKEKIDLTGAYIKVNLNGSETEIPITPDMISGFDNTKIGEQEITVTAYSAKTSFVITVIDYILGDLDGDSELSDWDGVLLARYLAGWNVEIPTLDALDIDGDGEITDWDGVVLDRYLAGWNISIGLKEN